MTFCVLIRGPLASGKTTIANALADRTGARVISVDRILDEQGLEEWEDHSDGTYCVTEKSFLRANDFVLEDASRLHARGQSTIIDGNFYWRSTVEDLVGRIGTVCHVFTLKVPLSVCVERNKTRAHPIGNEMDVKMVFDEVSSFDVGTLVDVTGTVEEAVEAIRASLRASPPASG